MALDDRRGIAGTSKKFGAKDVQKRSSKLRLMLLNTPLIFQINDPSAKESSAMNLSILWASCKKISKNNMYYYSSI